MIRLAFLINREVLNFAIQDKVIKYTDRKWGKWVQCVPKDPSVTNEIRMSRNRLPSFFTTLFDLTNEEQEEYDAAQTDEDIARIVTRDALTKGCKLMAPTITEGPIEKKEEEKPEVKKDWREELDKIEKKDKK